MDVPRIIFPPAPPPSSCCCTQYHYIYHYNYFLILLYYHGVRLTGQYLPAHLYLEILQILALLFSMAFCAIFHLDLGGSNPHTTHKSSTKSPPPLFVPLVLVTPSQHVPTSEYAESSLFLIA